MDYKYKHRWFFGMIILQIINLLLLLAIGKEYNYTFSFVLLLAEAMKIIVFTSSEDWARTLEDKIKMMEFTMGFLKYIDKDKDEI